MRKNLYTLGDVPQSKTKQDKKEIQDDFVSSSSSRAKKRSFFSFRDTEHCICFLSFWDFFILENISKPLYQLKLPLN